MSERQHHKKRDLPPVSDMPRRPRRNRASKSIRELVRETRLSPADFIMPLFVIDGAGREDPIASMPAYGTAYAVMTLQRCLGSSE